MSARLLAATLIGLACTHVTVVAQDSTARLDLSETYRLVVASVTYVEVGTLMQKTGSASGFVLHADGYVVTAAHVVEDADVVRVEFHDGTTSEAKIVTMSRAQDLALLKVEKVPDGVQPAKLGDVSKVTPGQPVFCIGAPRDLRFSITTGIVSAVREKVRQSEFDLYQPNRMIQTDTAINPGNSGGPIFNYDGEVIGVAVATIPDARDIGWAVPVDLIRPYLIEQAVPFAGVVYRRLPEEFSKLMNWHPAEAIIVERVQMGSFAERSGLRGGVVTANLDGLSFMLGGDVIYFIGGHPVSEHEQVRDYLRGLTKSDEVKVTVWREGELVELSAPFTILHSIPSIELPEG